MKMILAYQQNAFGWCHGSCLSKSQWGAFWTERRIWHSISIKGFSKLHASPDLTVLSHPRTNERIILRSDGISFNIHSSMLEHQKECPGGIMLPVFEEINLELDEPELAHEIRDALVDTKQFPLRKLIDNLNLNNYILYPDAVADGMLHFNKALKREWLGEWISADISYNQFIPDEVLEFSFTKIA